MKVMRPQVNGVWWLSVLVLLLGGPRAGWTAPPITALAFAPEGNRVVIGSQAGLRIEMGCAGQSPAGHFDDLPPAIHDVRFSPAGDRLLVAGGVPGELGRVVLFRWPDRTRLWDRDVAADVLYAVDWSDDSSRIATASHDGIGRILAADDGEVKQQLNGHSAGLIDLTWVDDQLVLTAGRDATLRLWQASDGTLVRTFNNHVGALTGVARRPTGQGLPLVNSIGGDRTIRFWQPTIGRLVRFLRLETARPVTAVWLPGGTRLLVGTTAGEVLLVDPLTTAIERTWKVASSGEEAWITALAVRPRGREVVVGDSRGNVQLLPLELPASR